MIRLYTCCFILFILASCGQDSDIFIQQSNQISIDQLFEELTEPGQTHSFYGDNASVHFITEEGILITIDPSKLLSSDNTQSMGEHTISVEVLNESKEVFFHQLSTEIDGSLFNPEVIIQFSITDDKGDKIQVSEGAVKCYIPAQFDDSSNIGLYRDQLDGWQEYSEQSTLDVGDFIIENSEATIWSDFGYTFYAEPEVWYTVTSVRAQTAVSSSQLCVESVYNYTDTRMYLVNTVNNSAVIVSYSTLLDQFCESWMSYLEENRYMLYVVSAYNEIEYGLAIVDITDLTDSNEINLPFDGKKLDKETMLSLLSE